MQAKSLMLALLMIAMPLSGCIAGDDGQKDDEITDLETMRDDLQLERDTLQSELSTIEAELVALQASSSSDADEISGLLSQIDSLNEQITALEASIVSLQMNVMQDNQSTLDLDCLFGQRMTISSIGFDNDGSGSLEGDEIISMSQMCAGTMASIPENADDGGYFYEDSAMFVVNGNDVIWVESSPIDMHHMGEDMYTVVLSDLTPNGTKSIHTEMDICYHIHDCEYTFHSVAEIQGGFIIKLGVSYYENKLIAFNYTSQQSQTLEWDMEKDTLNPDDCLVNYGDGIIFQGEDNDHGEELWFANLTHAHMIKDIREGTSDSNLRDCFNFGDMVVFFADDGTNGSEIWVTDGTEDGTTMLLDANPTGDGTPWNPTPIVKGGEFYFTGSDGEFGWELWASDGTASGTRMVKDLNPGTGSASTYALGSIGDAFYLISGADGAGNAGLYSTDGTPSGTELVCNMSSLSSYPGHALLHNGAIYFSGVDAGYNYSGDVWRYVPGGICEKFDTREGSNAANPRDWFVIGDNILFSGNSDEGYGIHLLTEDEHGNLAATTLMAPFGGIVKHLYGLSNGLVIYSEVNPWMDSYSQDYTWYWADYEYFGL
ncbi:MAG: hypothetical protein VX942_04505 [Candidatus Thermoplasmatota archaeon]|nr:hypothetical protein [Candidatus Thermoplasmatota archaeon]